MSGLKIAQTTVHQCWWCGELAEDQIVVEPERKAPVGSAYDFIPARLAWACGKHRAVALDGPARHPRHEGFRDADGKVWRP